MNNQVLLTPENVTATFLHGILVIQASRREEGLRNIQIEQAQLLPIVPPEFRVVGEESPAIGKFPYDVRASFKFEQNPGTIAIQTLQGLKLVRVTDLVDSEVASQLPAALTNALAATEVIGIAPNSYDVNSAISNAISKLQSQFPAHVSATVIETGVVAVGSPIGITYLYVKMQQQSGQ